MSRHTRISAVTIKKILFVFEGLFLIRRVTVNGAIQKPTYFLEDQGMASFLKSHSESWDLEFDITRGLYANLRHEFHYRPQLKGRILQYRTKNNVSVPLVFSWSGGTLGFVSSPDEIPRPKTLGSVGSFLKKFPKAKCVVAYAGKDIVAKAENHFWIPYPYLIQ